MASSVIRMSRNNTWVNPFASFRKSWAIWEMAAEVSFEEGLTKERITGETVRATLARLGVRWERAKRWITSPDPEYQRKKGGATD